ncbi:Vq motif-containing protein [Thalictrum thalictroides]|uniref:Vq motif-containing protein n=1 Tax=Thalictrum thalictroides TaxID=46969 RepID=A0A7J6WXQ4_THATH|nr:Vq motif-containing protein [Thalictrum thalictroides]
MKPSSELHETENPYSQTSPNSNSSNRSSSSSNSNGVQQNSPSTPKTPNRSQSNTDPTTYIQADTSSFKQVVQMLTGSSQTFHEASKTNNSSPKSIIPPIKTGPKKQGNKLYERRNSFKNFKVSPLMSGLVQNCGFSPRELEMLSPSILDFPSLVISSKVPLPLDSTPAVDQRITEKAFYLHPSPITTPRNSELRLLPLFPMTPAKVAGTST